MHTIRWALGAAALGMLPLAGCTTVLSPSPGAAYGSSSPSAGSAAGSGSSGPASPAGGRRPGGAVSAAKGAAPMVPAKIMLIVEQTKSGYVLAEGNGDTVYTDSQDKPGSRTPACVGGCLSAWPAVQGKPFTGRGVQLAGTIGSVTWPDGTTQATYNGSPLYTYAADTAPGQASGNGEGGVWHTVTGTALASTSQQATSDAAASKQAVAAARGAAGRQPGAAAPPPASAKAGAAGQ